MYIRKIHTNMRKKLFMVRVMEHWNRLPREVVEAPSLDTFRVRLDRAQGSLMEL